LADVYLAVKDKSFLGESKNQPNPKCPVGRQINTHLKDLYQEVEDALLKSLGNQTLADFAAKFK
jgi:DNA-binding IscR family transcriptional regulator